MKNTLYYHRLLGGSSGSSTPEKTTEDPWVRPSEWLEMPTLNLGEQKFVGLHAVFNNDSNFCSVYINGGNCTIDWGDGTIENYNFDTYCNHRYTYANIPENTITSYGYKQVIVTIIPQSGQTIRGYQLNKRSDEETSLYNYSSGWLDIRIVGSSVESLGLRGSNNYNNMIKHFSFKGPNNITSGSSLFKDCSGLECISEFDFSKFTTFASMFENCKNLKHLPPLNSTIVTSFSGTFRSCSSLRYIPAISTSNVWIFYGTFQYCSSLLYVPTINAENATTIQSMFANCYLIRNITIHTSSLCSDFSGAFSGCSSLKSITGLDTSGGTNFSQMFRYCNNIELPTLDTHKGINFSSMFENVFSIIDAPSLDLSKGTLFDSMFMNCLNLKSIPAYNLGSSVTAGTTVYCSSMFYFCFALKNIGNINTTRVTNMGSMFYYCLSLSSIKTVFDTSATTNMSQMFYECRSLAELPYFNTSLVTTFSSIFYNCNTLSKAVFQGTKETISYANCRLSKQAIVDIFNGLASGVTGKTITISNNWGTQYLTQTDRDIAINKGWTISG